MRAGYALEVAAAERADPVHERARELAAEYDAENFDAVVIGTHGDDTIGRLFVGDVAETVFRRSPVPVTVVR